MLECHQYEQTYFFSGAELAVLTAQEEINNDVIIMIVMEFFLMKLIFPHSIVAGGLHGVTGSNLLAVLLFNYWVIE